MIEHIRTIGFKGFDLDEPVPNKVIYCGKNKSGKSTRAGAIAIALFGHIPFSTAGKKPGDILDSFGKDSLVVAVKIKGTEFGRKFSRNAKGGVSQAMQINGKKASKENFAIMLNKVGWPRIADVAEFMKQSEAKKVDTLFELFPNDELASIDTEIEKAKEDVSRLDKKKIGAESTIVRLTNSKAEIQLPPGSISEVQAEIKDIDTRVVDYENQIKQAEIKEAEIKAEQKGKEEAERKSKEEAERQTLQKMGASKQDTPEPPQPDDSNFYGDREIIYPSQENTNAQPEHVANKLKNMPSPIESIERIISALNSVGCNTCAALIVAKQELKKYE